MSIQTMKKKTEAKYRNNSVGYSQFSLVGTHRNQGYIGQEMASRTILKTPFRGNVPRGHGGSQGLYPVAVLTPYGTSTVENSFVPKSSVLSAYGAIQTQFPPSQYTVVKPDDQRSFTSQSRLERLRKCALRRTNDGNGAGSSGISPSNTGTGSGPRFACPLTTKFVGPLSQSDYLAQINKICSELDVLPVSSIKHTPLPM
jgi:hypothetical protein